MKRLSLCLHYIFLFLSVLLVSCNDETKVQSVQISPAVLNLSAGEKYQLELLVTPLSAAIHNPTAWNSSDNNVAVVDKNGVVTAISAGECRITGQAMHTMAVCNVTVAAPAYNMQFKNAIVFNEGDKDNTGADNLILRLYNDDITIDENGRIYGNGIFVNLLLLADKVDGYIPEDKYVVDSLRAVSAVVPGRLYESAGSYYASGSFVGQYTNNGLSVLFLKDGFVDIENSADKICSVLCDMKGENNEIFNAEYSGLPQYHRTDLEAGTTEMEYLSAEISEFQSPVESVLNRVKITLSSPLCTIVLYARTPRSITGAVPDGVYHVSAVDKAFTLHCETDTPQCTIEHDGKTHIIISGTVDISTDTEGNQFFEASFADDSGNEYLVTPQLNNSRKIHAGQFKIPSFR